MEKEIGRIKKGEYQGTITEIVVGIKEYNGKVGVDIREFTKSETYTGPTKKGLRIPSESFKEFQRMISLIDPKEFENQEPKQEKLVEPSSENSSEEDSGIDNEGYM